MKLTIIFTTALIMSSLVGCSSNVQTPQSQSVSENGIANASCGPQTLSAYSKLRSNEHRIEDIYELMNKPSGDAVTMLELKQTAQQLGFQTEGYLLDPDNLEGIETYAIIPVGENKTGSRSDPLHFVLVRFSKGNIFEIDCNTMEQKPVEPEKLTKVWKGPALFLR